MTQPYELLNASVDPSADTGRSVSEVDIVINCYFPVQTKRVRKRSNPWMDNAVKHRIRERDETYKQMILTIGEEQIHLRAEFQSLRYKVRWAITDSRRDFFLRQRHNRQKLWEVPNEQLNRKIRLETSANLGINEINQHFVSMGQHEAVHAAPPVNAPSNVVRLPKIVNAIHFQPVQPLEVHEFLREIVRKKKACRPNAIPHLIMAAIHHHLVISLNHLISKCWSRGICFDVFKVAEVVPIPKSAHPHIGDEYRPFTLVSNLSKCLKKLHIVDWPVTLNH